MKAGKIIKNAKIFTSDKDNPQATALVVKDGKFVYVGDEAGLSDYEGEVTDFGGKFIMPGIIDSHAAEIPYLFDTCLADPMGSGEIVSTEECEFRHVVKEMWANFARTGNPFTDKYEWKKFSGDDRQTMVFDDAIGMQKDLFGRREDLMMSWAERLGNWAYTHT